MKIQDYSTDALADHMDGTARIDGVTNKAALAELNSRTLTRTVKVTVKYALDRVQTPSRGEFEIEVTGTHDDAAQAVRDLIEAEYPGKRIINRDRKVTVYGWGCGRRSVHSPVWLGSKR